MAKFIRYTLATVCIAASVGWLTLWWRSNSVRDVIILYLVPETGCVLDSDTGELYVETSTECRVPWRRGISHLTESDSEFTLLPITASFDFDGIHDRVRGMDDSERFEAGPTFVRVPLWYSALVSSLAGVAALRVGRRFTLRSTLIAVTAVAALLGMAAGL